MMAASRAATTGAGMLQILCKIVVQIEDNIDEQKVWHKYTQKYIIPSFAHFARLQIWWIFGSCQLRCKSSVDGIRAVRSADTCDDLTSDVWTWRHVTWDHAMVTPVHWRMRRPETDSQISTILSYNPPMMIVTTVVTKQFDLGLYMTKSNYPAYLASVIKIKLIKNNFPYYYEVEVL